MTAIATPVRILREDESGRRFIVAGDLGAVECRTSPAGVPVLVDYHYIDPAFTGDEPSDCDVIAAPCYPEAGGAVATLRAAWLRAGGDDEVIWADLEARYRAGMEDGR